MYFVDMCLYQGGAAVHANGHFYMIHTNRLIRFWKLDLYNSTSFVLPTNFDPYLTQTNGKGARDFLLHDSHC